MGWPTTRSGRIIWEELQRQPPPPATAGRRLARVAYVPELDLLLQTFPFDHRLPALEPLMTGPVPGLVDPLLARFGPGDWRLDGWDAESMRYRVDLRASVRLTVRASEVRTGSAAEGRFFAKVYARPEEVERAWGIQREVAAALGAEHEPLTVAPLVAHLPGRASCPGIGAGVSLRIVRNPPRMPATPIRTRTARPSRPCTARSPRRRTASRFGVGPAAAAPHTDQIRAVRATCSCSGRIGRGAGRAGRFQRQCPGHGDSSRPLALGRPRLVLDLDKLPPAPCKMSQHADPLGPCV